VIIKGPSGKLLATTTLHKNAKATSALSLPSSLSSSGQVGVYEFKTTIPAGSGPYTVELVGVNSVVVSAKQLHHLHLTC
jgi:predicted ATP-dependent Lon-type protease